MIRNEKTHLPMAALTHPGMKGKNNEDRFGVAAFRMDAQPATPVLLAILSDGIGGHRAGEVASELAVNTIIQYASASDGKRPLHVLEEAIIFASQAIHQQSQQNPEQVGMGATCACAWIAGDRLYTATVGDSRIYLIRGETIEQISIDHTWIQEALERGLIQPDQVNGHPNAHVIRRYLGSPNPPEVDFRIRSMEGKEERVQGMRLLPKDLLLLCSDGLTDLVDNQEIYSTFRSAPLEEAGQQLIDLANQRGGHDNITLVTIQMPEKPAQSPETPSKALGPALSSRSILAGCLGIIVIAVIAGALAGGWLLYSGRTKPTITPTSEPAPQRILTGPASPTLSPTRTWTEVATLPSLILPTQTQTPTPKKQPEGAATITPVHINTPTLGLPVITNTPGQQP
jgi:serine/threonine protein phosphatase PrpC